MVPLQNIDTLDTVLTCSLSVLIFVGVLNFCCQLFGQEWLYVELYLEDRKCVLLYKLHIDYSKIYPSLICTVLSLEKLY